jgi:hypothetical protein
METIRNIAAILFIITAILDIILLVVLALIALAIWRLLQMVRSELPPVFGTVRRTATTVEGTADFVSTTVAMPLIRSVSFVYAISRFFQVLLSRGHSSSESRS